MSDPAQPPGPATWPLPAGPAPAPQVPAGTPGPQGPGPAHAGGDPNGRPSTTARVIGLLLIAPALILLLIQWVVPTLTTVWDSVHEVSFTSRRGDLVGLDNYELILRFVTRSGLPWLPIAWTLVITAVSILSALGIAAAARGGRLSRRLARGAVVVLLALVSPVGVTVAWQRLLGADLSDPGAESLLIAVLGHAPAATGLLALALLATNDRRGPGSGRRTTVVVVVVAVLVAGAAGLQLYDLPLFLDPRATTLSQAGVQAGLVSGRFGAMAAAGVLMFVPLAVLGLVSVALVVGSRLRLVPVAADASPDDPGSSGRGVVGIAVALAAAVLAMIAFGPVVAGWTAPLPLGAGDVVRASLVTLIPALVSATAQLTVSAAAGFGIGRLAPLGRRSPWLLFLFAPWALSGRQPFSLSDFTFVREVGLLDSPIGLIPPVQVSPTVVVLTALLFAATRSELGGQRLRPLPVAGLLALIGGVITVAQAATVQWSLLIVSSTELSTGPLMMRRLAFVEGARAPLATVYAYGPVTLVVSLAVAAAIVAATSRIALRSGSDPRTISPSERR